MFNKNRLLSISTLIGLYGLFNLVNKKKENQVKNIAYNNEVNENTKILASYNNNNNNNLSTEISDYEDSSDSELSDDFYLKDYQLTEYEYQ
jgi:hypothetical protein